MIQLTLGLLLVLITPAVGDKRFVLDPNDTKGRLDVRAVTHGHRSERSLRHKLKMFSQWPSRALSHRASYIYIWFSTDEDDYAERRIVIDYKKERLTATMEKYEEEPHGAGVARLADVPVSRPTAKTIKVVFKSRLLGRDIRSYAWSVTTAYKREASRSCGRGDPTCFDNAPRGTGRGRVTHNF